MGFRKVSIDISLTREDMAELLIDNKRVVALTSQNEAIAINGFGVHKMEPKLDGNGITHVFQSSVELKEEYIWCKVSLSTENGFRFIGQITYDSYLDDTCE
ncbi:TPA: hypothetical protein DIU27_01510 [Candidatus Collierbacteria bacterium]|uniref:Uncharacterized protein n=1 Tax=Candidatus Collierbacteria bacterium GW2011_GWB2_44_22 TaxID=1618387 RepID=A0A0G1KUS3_9BACT|nr:MAG: hypothetical protein UW31_C0005G0140 [Candidatus Collierbacteria bacterium GW2011_GWA2_44_13]KKT51629.1 MAG: hypothetical protein UW44_C0010G0067 [Candidatus Collierbacteria bacterium GW2011_GWB2_44_22]KKT63080.1 MAG: hypothetical protein UW56_C0002G0065 [Candidatus Collierbacteria bacterium GW2011_GWD1_44_27]KKT64002.1 MAG: hypothetical protein UW58_C0051G0004 [Candidatus Collierbacteria bacterium GW2011_GWC2_44_30]KKT89572.1 MAG: hypothetical protein UW88_C0002G0103 [Candidatus Collie